MIDQHTRGQAAALARVTALVVVVLLSGILCVLAAGGNLAQALAVGAAVWFVATALLLAAVCAAAFVRRLLALARHLQARRAAIADTTSAGRGRVAGPACCPSEQAMSARPRGQAGDALRLDVGEEVQALLSDDELLEIVDMREHSELRCLRCDRAIPPESEETISVVVLLDPLRNTRTTAVAHLDCERTQVLVCDLPLEQLHGRPAELAWVGVLRPRALPRAALVWEPRLSLRTVTETGASENVYLAGLRAHGFQQVTDGILRLEARPLPDWRLERAGDELRLHAPGGSIETFSGVQASSPPGWLAALEDERACLLAAGCGLGLDRPTLQRIDAALQAGKAVAAAAPLT